MKAAPRREYLIFVECLLYEYYKNKRELKTLERAIEACCRGSGISAAESGSADAYSCSMPERVTDAKLNNEDYRFLERRIARVSKALSRLSKSEAEFVRMMFLECMRCWEIAEELKTDDRQVRRIKTRILCKVAPSLLEDWIN